MAKLGPGARVGDQFHLIRKIGEGGCGEVYLAEQTTLGRNTVVKLMHPELSRDQSYVARFQREARLAARLIHHHTAAIYAFGETPDKVLWINFPSSVHLQPDATVERVAFDLAEQAGATEGFLVGITEDMPPERWQDSCRSIMDGLDRHARTRPDRYTP